MLTRESLLAYRHCRDDQGKLDLFMVFYERFCTAHLCLFAKACVIGKLRLPRDYYSEDLSEYSALYIELTNHSRVNLLIEWYWGATSREISLVEELLSGKHNERLIEEEKTYSAIYERKRASRGSVPENLIQYQRVDRRSIVRSFEFPSLSFCPCAFLSFFWE